MNCPVPEIEKKIKRDFGKKVTSKDIQNRRAALRNDDADDLKPAIEILQKIPGKYV